MTIYALSTHSLTQCIEIIIYLALIHLATEFNSWARGYKTFFVLNSVEHEIFPANIY